MKTCGNCMHCHDRNPIHNPKFQLGDRVQFTAPGLQGNGLKGTITGETHTCPEHEKDTYWVCWDNNTHTGLHPELLEKIVGEKLTDW